MAFTRWRLTAPAMMLSARSSVIRSSACSSVRATQVVCQISWDARCPPDCTTTGAEGKIFRSLDGLTDDLHHEQLQAQVMLPELGVQLLGLP